MICTYDAGGPARGRGIRRRKMASASASAAAGAGARCLRIRRASHAHVTAARTLSCRRAGSGTVVDRSQGGRPRSIWHLRRCVTCACAPPAPRSAHCPTRSFSVAGRRQVQCEYEYCPRRRRRLAIRSAHALFPAGFRKRIYTHAWRATRGGQGAPPGRNPSDRPAQIRTAAAGHGLPGSRSR